MLIDVKIKRVSDLDIPLPRYESAEASGFDLCAALSEDLVLLSGERQLVPTGFAIQLPFGYEGQIRPRSGLSIRHGITLVNSPGTVDSDYRGELMVPLINLGRESFTISPLMRIAQMIIMPIVQANFSEATDLDDTIRGSGGFGSTGLTGTSKSLENQDVRGSRSALKKAG